MLLTKGEVQEFERLLGVAHREGQREPRAAIRWVKAWTVNSIAFSDAERDYKRRLRLALQLFPTSAQNRASRTLRRGGAK